jgi:hypothetical protein
MRAREHAIDMHVGMQTSACERELQNIVALAIPHQTKREGIVYERDMSIDAPPQQAGQPTSTCSRSSTLTTSRTHSSDHCRVWYLPHVIINHTSSHNRRQISVKSGFRSGYIWRGGGA